MAAALKKNTVVTTLILEGADVKDSGVKHLAKMLGMNDHVTTLILRDTAISDEGVRVLCDALQFQSTLTHLGMSCAVRSGRGGESREGIAGDGGCRGRFVGGVGWSAVNGGVLKRDVGWRGMTDLSLNGIGPDGARSLALMLRSNSYLETLVLSFNRVRVCFPGSDGRCARSVGWVSVDAYVCVRHGSGW